MEGLLPPDRPTSKAVGRPCPLWPTSFGQRLGGKRKQAEQAVGTKPVNSIRPWLLHDFLPLGSCLALTSLVMSCEL